MLVRCPSCATTYKVADELLTGASPVFRCSRCKHTFELEPAAASEWPAVEKSLASEALPKPKNKEEELTFTFPSDVSAETKRLESGGERQEPAALPGHLFSPPRGETADRKSVLSREPKQEAPLMISPEVRAKEKVIDPQPPPSASLQSQPQATRQQEINDNVLPLDPYRDQPASVVPYLTILALLVIFFGLLTAFHQVHPNASEGIVKKIPLLGPSVLKNSHLKNGVNLQSLRAGYQNIQNNREVFVITGMALNVNPVVIRDVRLAAQLYDQAGKVIEQQTIWIGNAISAKIIRGMTAQDISDLQRLKPLKTFDIPPGDSVPFAIVFLKAPKSVKDFTCDVLSAEAET